MAIVCAVQSTRSPIAVLASCAKTRPMGLRGCSVVELEHAAEALSALDWAFSDQRGLGRDEFIAQILVRPLLMAMVDKRSDGCPEVRFAERHDPRQTLRSGRPDKALADAFKFGLRARRRTSVTPLSRRRLRKVAV